MYEKQKQREKRGYDGEENDLLLKNASLRSYRHDIRPSFIPKNVEIYQSEIL